MQEKSVIFAANKKEICSYSQIVRSLLALLSSYQKKWDEIGCMLLGRCLSLCTEEGVFLLDCKMVHESSVVLRKASFLF